MPAVRHLGLFPWCDSARIGDSGWGSAHVISAEEATLLWWRAKRIGIRNFENVDISINGIRPIISSPVISPATINERFLVCQTRTSKTFSQSGIQFFPGIRIGASSFIQIILAHNIDATSDDDMFLFQYFGRASYGGLGIKDVDGERSVTNFDFLVNNVEPDPPAFGKLLSTFSFNGKVFENRISNFDTVSDLTITEGTLGPDPYPYTFNYIFPDFEILEYWPYDPGDGGGPIYDSATGAQLRPFPAH